MRGQALRGVQFAEATTFLFGAQRHRLLGGGERRQRGTMACADRRQRVVEVGIGFDADGRLRRRPTEPRHTQVARVQRVLHVAHEPLLGRADEEVAVAQLDPLVAERDHSLHEVFALVRGREHSEVVAPQRVGMGKTIDEHDVAALRLPIESRLHAAARDDVALGDFVAQGLEDQPGHHGDRHRLTEQGFHAGQPP